MKRHIIAKALVAMFAASVLSVGCTRAQQEAAPAVAPEAEPEAAPAPAPDAGVPADDQPAE